MTKNEVPRTKAEVDDRISEYEKELSSLYRKIEEVHKELLCFYRIRDRMTKNNRRRSKKQKSKKSINKKCYVCGDPVYAKKLCHSCYERKRRSGNPYPKPKAQKIQPKIGRANRARQQILDHYLMTKDEAYKKVLSLNLNDRNTRIFYNYVILNKIQTEIANDEGLSKERVRQIIIKCFEMAAKGPQELHPQELHPQELHPQELHPDDDILNHLLSPEVELKDLNLNVRTYNALSRAGINTMKDLQEFIESHEKGLVHYIRNLGEGSKRNLLEAIIAHEEKEQSS